MHAAKLSVAILIGLPIAALAQDQPPPSQSRQQSTQEQSPQDQTTPGQSSQDQSAQTRQRPSTQQRSTLEEGQTSTTCVGNIVFSQEFLDRYPQAGSACREVKVENGMKWARFDANVTRVRGNRVTANFVSRSDQNLGRITFDASRDARVDVNGRSTRFSRLKRGDRLSVWMPEDRVGFYAEPGASESTKLAVVETGPARR